MTSSAWRVPLIGALVTFAVTATLLMIMRPLMAIDETRYVTVAWEMWQGGSKIVPHLNGGIYSDKPPLLFWLINLVWGVTGPSEWAARLVAPGFGLLSVWLVAVLARRLWPEAPERSGLAALILASTGVFLLFGSTTMFDTMLAAATLLGMIAIWSLKDGLRIGPVLGLGVALGLGVFAKGPVILVHVLPAALLMPLWARAEGRPSIKGWYGRIGLAFLIAFGIVLLWLGPAVIFGGAAYREQILWKQSAGRMVESFAHGRPVWFFLALMPFFLWPWGWSRAGLAALKPSRLWADAGSRFVTLWGVSAFVAFSMISGKQAHYLVPELPALALLLSGMVPTAERRLRALRLLWLLPGILAAIAAAAVPFGAFPELPEGTGSWLLLGAGVAILLLAGVILMRARDGWRVEGLVAPMVLVAIEIMVLPILWTVYDPRPIGALIAAHSAHGVATTDRSYAGQFSYVARLAQPVDVIGNSADLGRWMAAHPQGLVLSAQPLDGVDGLSEIAERHFRQDDWRLYQVGAVTPPEAPAPSATGD
ncbi:ArnT family glycosyltransferase [Thioclava atlantica]|uniref:Glycosyltransferase n=1 Tax=Thioclava atlantica TaxID=1317124 RepID=A0A085TTC4_9RHOB|nr:glycosyltransferase family 39 protein [Thioclava atlantica]KFE33971.1 glycosyltransferase [Thioclava atlantica]